LILQVLNFGHWKEGACMLLGEETERVFSIFGPYQNSTKYMSEGSNTANSYFSLNNFIN
jgi:hypothetical protein